MVDVVEKETARKLIPYHYIVVHQSVANRLGVLAAQVAHAAAESVRDVSVPENTRVVVLVAKDAGELLGVSASLNKIGHTHHALIREPDPPYHGAPTALGVLTWDRDAVREVMNHFNLALLSGKADIEMYEKRIAELEEAERRRQPLGPMPYDGRHLL